MTTARAALAAAYADGPGKAITPGPAPTARAMTGPRRPLTDLAAQGPFAASVARLLVDVASPARWEPWNQYNDHRAYPSPRAAYLLDLAIASGGGTWPVDPVRRATIGAAVPVLRSPVRLAFTRRPDRLSDGYGEFAAALVELETGHLASALVDRATSLGLRAEADGAGVTLWPSQSIDAGPLPARSSGFGPRGFAADPRPLPTEAVSTFTSAIADRPPGALDQSQLRCRLALHNVVGLVDGWYSPNPLELVHAAPAMAQAQRAFGHPQSVVDVAGMNLVLVITADVAEAVATDGPDAYAALLRAAGSCAQQVCLASAAVGLFCRPVRSVSDHRLEADCGAPGSHSLLYVLLAGRSRVRGFPYHLGPLEAPC